jgi:uncharacterized protein YlxW (UPF0749 family)
MYRTLFVLPMYCMSIALLQIPPLVSEAARPLVEYGVVGAVLILALAGIIYMYIANAKGERARHELFRQDMQAVAKGNRDERERWQEIDAQRFTAMRNMADSYNTSIQQMSAQMNDSTNRNTSALTQLSTIIQERIHK